MGSQKHPTGPASTSSPSPESGSSVPAAGNEQEKKSPSERSDEGQVLMNKFFVYILECADKSLYVGCTNNLERRLEQHNNSKWGAHYTKIRRPVILKYSEKFETLREARRRESEIKGWRRGKKLELFNNGLRRV